MRSGFAEAVRQATSAPCIWRFVFPMLDENGVTQAVSNHLKSRGYQILQECTTNDRGVDIVAEPPAHSGRLLIEAKGGKSSKPGTRRYGQEYRKPELGIDVYMVRPNLAVYTL